ncbi:uncharacterized protein LOC131956915 [Physella acuta]|uniref:uncharacterized protein LOC131956915 n=1 Tax=Physella acuta TaxID=109671 RepID=UPI0027DE6797|nr:uncharacterized protein LOC131956915 [Physella acuta]XP_059177541.1 uncharacterized protein LOC131956915 [Physella acuta]XP_059177551.1 uncharacterized protein LOC131956915 [Physella acuta]
MSMPVDDFLSHLPPEVINYSSQKCVDALDLMHRDLHELQDKLLKLAVQSHILEVDLATQFSPDLSLAVDKAVESCLTCTQAVVSSHVAMDSVMECTESGESCQLPADTYSLVKPGL